MKRTFKMKILSFALAFITAVMLFPYGTLTAYAVNEETEADADENLVNEPLIEENDTATATEPENSTSAPVEEETEIFYDEYEIENTAMSAPPMTQIGGTAEPNALTVLPDGVYEIENVGNDNYYMTVENNYAVAGYRMVQQNYSSNTPLTNFSRSSLFKVSRIGNTNQYVIRSMLNNRISFTTGTDIDINKFSTGYINTNDSNVNTTYTILQSGGVYTIHPYGSTSVLAAPNTTVSGENDPAAAQLILSTSSAAGNRGKWKFTAYTGNIKYGTARTQTLSMSNGLAEGKNGTVWIKGWSTVIGANTPYMSVESGYTDIAISTWDDYAGGAIVIGRKSGDFELKAEIRTDPSTAATHTNLYTYTIIPDVVDNAAYIQNAVTGKYVEIESASTADGGIIQQCFFHTMDHMKWTFELGGSGYLRIKSLKSGKYIGVDSADTTKVKQYSAATDYTLWKFVETARGNYKLICKATASSGKVLSVPSSTSGNYVDLTMLAYVDDADLKDEWVIHKLCDDGGSLDIQLHSFSLNTSGVYVCSKCICRVSSPLLEDESILTTEDYQKVQSLYMASGVLKKLAHSGGIAGDYTEYAYIMPLKLADEIRSKDVYDGEYAYSGANGKCYAMHSDLYNTVMAGYNVTIDRVFLQKKCQYYESVNSIETFALNGTLNNLVYLSLGLFGMYANTDIVTALLYSASSTQPIDDINNLMDNIIGFVPDVGTRNALSLMYSLIAFGASSSSAGYCNVGDNVVTITLVDNLNREYLFGFAFDESGQVVGESIDIGYTYN